MANLLRKFGLSGSEVHVWAVELCVGENRLEELRSFLTPDENARADSFRSVHLKDRFVICRGMLRVLIGAYTAIPPEEIRFCYTPRGKPLLAEEAGLHFNVSHSGDVALFGITTRCELGIDIEWIHDIPNLEGIADRFFSPEEATDLAAVENSLRIESFFACWTRKEAYIKATGEGLQTSLESFRVTLRPNEPARLVHIAGDTSEASMWSICHLSPAPGYVGALAFRDTRRIVRASSCRSVEQTLMHLNHPGVLRRLEPS